MTCPRTLFIPAPVARRARCCAKSQAPQWPGPGGRSARPGGDVARFHAQALVFFGLGKKAASQAPAASSRMPAARASARWLVALIVLVVGCSAARSSSQEGQKAVVTTFGQVSPRWRPAGAGAGRTRSRPTRRSISRTEDRRVGGSSISASPASRFAMLTQDENIVDVRSTCSTA